MMSPEDAIRHALDGNAILFTGAGFSWGAKNIDVNPEKRSIPAGRALANLLLSEIGYQPQPLSLDKAASAYLRRKSRDNLVNLLVPLFTVSEVSDAHREIAALPFRRVYTTNYDTVFERARTDLHLVHNTAEGGDDPRQHLHKEGLVVHINGVIDRLSADKFGGVFKLASDSYASESFENSGWAFQFRNDVRAAKAVIFIGYSMYDLDVRRAIFHEDISDRCVFITAPLTSDNELDGEDLIDLGVVAPVGINEFARQVGVIKREYIPLELELTLEAWEELASPKSSVSSPTDKEVLDFLVFGEFSESLRNEALGQERGRYTIIRDAYSRIIEDLRAGLSPVFIIGDLGTGKSVLCEMLGAEFSRSGVRVFRLDHASNNDVSELQEICAQPGIKMLIVENYQRHVDVLRWLSISRVDDVLLIFTARTSSHDLFQKEVLQLFPKMRLYDMSILDIKEISCAVDLFDRYGVWGERASFSQQRKIRYLEDDCSGALPSALADILRSQCIKEKYSKLIQDSADKSGVEAFLICAFSLEVMGFTPSMARVQELLANSIDWAALRTQTELKSVIHFGASRIRARSSVLAKYILSEVFSARRVVSVLVGMAKEADARRIDKDYYQVLNGVMRYGNVSIILSDENRLESTIGFYEGVKNLTATRRNPQFWLQYAIACLALGKLERSERYFKSAYSLANTSDGYNTFQIDNHYARWLLESAFLDANFEDGKRKVDKAVSILLQQMIEEVKFYPYRVAIGIFKFYDKSRPHLLPAHKQSFLKVFSEIKRRADASPVNLRRNKYVVECVKKAEQALLELSSV